MAPAGTPARGALARLARDTACPACGRPLRDPVLLPCEHSCCRRCLLTAPDGPGHPPSAACPRCRRPCAPGRVRTAVALAVEARIVRRLAGDGDGGDSSGDSRGDSRGDSGDNSGDRESLPRPGQRRARRCSLGAQLRADAAPPPRPPTPRGPPRNRAPLADPSPQ